MVLLWTTSVLAFPASRRRQRVEGGVESAAIKAAADKSRRRRERGGAATPFSTAVRAGVGGMCHRF